MAGVQQENELARLYFEVDLRHQGCKAGQRGKVLDVTRVDAVLFVYLQHALSVVLVMALQPVQPSH